MKKVRIFLLSWLSLALWGLSNTNAQNLIPNPGFELGTGDNFTNWNKFNGGSQLLQTTTAGEYRSGSRALKAAVAAAGTPFSVQLASDLIPTTIGASYTFRIWVKSANGGTNIRFSTNPSALYSANYNITTTYTQISWTFTANVANTRIVLDLGSGVNTYFLDDMEMLEPVNTSPNLILNGGFENTFSTTEFNNWGKWNGAAFLNPTTVAGEVRTGTTALKATPDGTQPNAGSGFSLQLTSDAVSLVAGATYAFRVWVKPLLAGTTAAPKRIQISVTGASTQFSPQFNLTSNDWQVVTYQFVANANSSRVQLNLGQDVNTYFVDDAELKIVCGVTFYTPPSSQTPIANGKNKFLGTVYSGTDLANIPKYFNQITPENEGKWGSIETADGTFNWAGVDAARAFAVNNNFPFRFHVLVWGNQQPTWLKPLNNTQKIQNIRDWFQAVANRYNQESGPFKKLEYIEVANEVLNDPPNNTGANATDTGSGDYLDALRSLNSELGTTPWAYDWVINSFKLARQYFPCETKLVLNEYGVENNTSLMTSYAAIVDSLRKENLIDVVGIQAHSFSTRSYTSETTPADTAFLKTNLNILAAKQVPVMVTEMDIDGNRPLAGTDAQKDQFQLDEYKRIFSLYWNHPSVIGITLWGYRTGMWRTAQAAYLVDVCSGSERPALRDFLNNTLSDNPNSIRALGNPPLGNNFLPSICNEPLDISVACAANIPLASTSTITARANNCPGAVTVTVNDVSSTPVNGSYIVTRTWTATDACGNAKTAIQKITVNTVSSPTSVLANNVKICSSGNITLTALCAAGTTVKWYNTPTGGVSIGTGSPLNVSVSATTTYYAVCTLSSCESERVPTEQVVVTPKPETPVITPSITNICIAGGSATLSTTGCAGGILNWTGGLTGTSINVSPASTTTYTVTCTINDCVSSNSLPATVNVGDTMESVKSGDWADPTTWSCNRIPTSSDNITINPSHTVTVTNADAKAKNILNNGTLNLSNSACKITLAE